MAPIETTTTMTTMATTSMTGTADPDVWMETTEDERRDPDDDEDDEDDDDLSNASFDYRLSRLHVSFSLPLRFGDDDDDPDDLMTITTRLCCRTRRILCVSKMKPFPASTRPS